MKKIIYGIYDKKANSYRTHFDEVNDQVALRNVANVVNDNNSRDELSINSADFDLYQLGEIDTTTGIIISKVEFMKNLNELKFVRKGK